MSPWAKMADEKTEMLQKMRRDSLTNPTPKISNPWKMGHKKPADAAEKDGASVFDRVENVYGKMRGEKK